MEKTLDIAFDLLKIDILWFEKFSSNNPDVEDFVGMHADELEDPNNPMFVLTCAYDFDISHDQGRKFYVDTYAKLPHYAILKIRVHYGMEEIEDFEWDDLFTPGRLGVLVENAIQNGLYHYVIQCKANGVTLPSGILEHEPEIPRQEIDNLTTNLIDDYFSHRKPFLQANAGGFEMHAITLPPVQNWIVTINLTLMIMEEVLFNNLHFNRRDNREKFFTIVPEPFFYSMRNKCLGLNKQEITLNQVEMHYLLIAQDCALQMAMGEKADFLNEVMVSRGFIKDVQKIWHTGAGKLVELCRGTVKESIESKEKFDWYKMLS
jgi:hypothetical protein